MKQYKCEQLDMFKVFKRKKENVHPYYRVFKENLKRMLNLIPHSKNTKKMFR